MNITIPKGITRIAPMILDDNCRSWHEKEADQAVAEYPLYEHAHIERLVISESVDIPHAERFSPFASYKQRPFVCNQATHCQRIEIACIENHSPHLLVEDGVLYSADKSRLIYCFEEKRSFVVPQSVKTIEPYAFSLQYSLAKIILHDDITFIGDAAFMACGALEEVLVPKQIKKIPDDCFDGCTSLSRVVLPDGLEAIGRNAFRQCKALKQIKLPETLIYIRGFEGCSALQEIEIPAGVERINEFMFCSSLRKVRLHEGVKHIDDYAFRYCANLTEINFPEGLEYVGARAFYPASLAKLLFPASLQEIGCEAFYHNPKLRSLEFRSANTKIDQAAFACCPLLFKHFIRKPDDLQINDDVFEADPGLDKYGFWD